MSNIPNVSGPDWLAEYPPPRSLPLDQEALRIYERAYYLGCKTEDEGNPPITFTTILTALLVGEDETSRWFAGLAKKNGPEAEAVFEEMKVDQKTVRELYTPTGKPAQVRLSSDHHLLTASAREVIENAANWAYRVGGSDIGVRHLVASYVLNPPSAHRAQIRRWKFQESKWRSEFFEWVELRYTAEQWTDASRRVAPTKAIPIFERQKVKGEALAFPGDANTLAILERAATYHGHRNDQWLRLQTVIYALIETAKNEHPVQNEIKPMWDAIKAIEQQNRELLTQFIPAPTNAESSASFSNLDISPRVLNALETARELAKATRRDSDSEFRVNTLHLAGALVSRRVDGDNFFIQLGINPQELRLQLIVHAQKKGESEELWREALGEEERPQTGRPVNLNSDEPEAIVRLDKDWMSDPLSIRGDVESFAALLASGSLEPPLSIGLFGPWGSGKTTFLKRLRRAVEFRAGEAKKSMKDSNRSPYVSNVVHVEFNAWHFAEDALTSSLVDTILRELSAYIKDDTLIEGTAWARQKLEALESTKRKVEAADALQKAAIVAVSAAENDLLEKRKLAAKQIGRLQEIAHDVWKVTKEKLQESEIVKGSGVLETAGDTIESTDDLRARLNVIRTRPARILSDLGWPRSLLFAALILGLPPMIRWLINKYLTSNQTSQFISAITAMVTVIGLWAKSAAMAVSKVDNAIAIVSNAYEQRLAGTPDVVNAKAVLDVAEARAATAAVDLQAAQQELARARTEAANAALPSQMLQLVSSRIEDRSYNKELTTLSLARADLAAISRLLLAQQNKSEPDGNAEVSPEAKPQTAPPKAVDRVILYIDDLDRCKPSDVVRVLQLVHMLLAFELFVVVVAVDAGWVEEALIQNYHWLVGSAEGPGPITTDGDVRQHKRTVRVTPQDYLEKIFQISFWLEPMTSARAASYLASLVRTPARKSPSDMRSAAAAGQSQEFSTSASENSQIEISGMELDYMRALAAYVGPSPRRVKRLVNAYRLIKARMSDAQLNTFLTDRAIDDSGLRSGPYQIVISLLVIGTGAPSSSAHILKELAEWDPGHSMDEVISQFRSRGHADWMMAAQVIETLMRTQQSKDVSELRGWARKVGRFLLNGPAAERKSDRNPANAARP